MTLYEPLKWLTLQLFCSFVNSSEAIEETLGEMGQMFVNNIKEMANVMDVTD